MKGWWLACAVAVVACLHLIAPGRSFTGVLEQRILWELSVPRLLTALLTGAALGVAGYVLQTTLRNPLAAPEFTGVNPGAVLGILVGLTLGTESMLAAAIVGGTAGGAITWVFSARRDPVHLVVYGLLCTALLAGLTTMLLAYQPSRFGNALRWLVGSVEGRVWDDLAVTWWWIIGWVVVAWLGSSMLAVLAPSDDHAASLGLNPALARGLALATAIALTAGAASLSGAIAFVGLVVPHVARRFAGRVVPAAAVTGALALTAADAVAQLANGLLDDTHRLGVPTGVVTALVGAAALIFLGRSQ